MGDDLDQSLTTAFEDTTRSLGHVLARPARPAPRRRRRIRVLVGTVGTLVPGRRLLRPDDSGEDVSTAGQPATTDGPTTSQATTTTGVTTMTALPTTAAQLGPTRWWRATGGWPSPAKLDVPVERLLEVNGATIEDNLFVGQGQGPPPTPTT